MAKIVIIGAGGVSNVVARKCAQISSVFEEIVIASRTLSKCDAIADAISKDNSVAIVETAQVDADSVDQLIQLFVKEKPYLVINVALPIEYRRC